MLRRPRVFLAPFGAALVGLLFIGGASGPVARGSAQAQSTHVQTVSIPGEDRFTPFALTIHRGETVRWVNSDTEDHTVVSDDFFNNTGPTGLDHLIQGTDSNAGNPGTFEIRFRHAGTFVYFCRFHSHLDAFHQPVAPGPEGGIADANGNFGTPMMGVITVLNGEDDQ